MVVPKPPSSRGELRKSVLEKSKSNDWRTNKMSNQLHSFNVTKVKSLDFFQRLVPGARFEHATSGKERLAPFDSRFLMWALLVPRL